MYIKVEISHLEAIEQIIKNSESEIYRLEHDTLLKHLGRSIKKNVNKHNHIIKAAKNLKKEMEKS